MPFDLGSCAMRRTDRRKEEDGHAKQKFAKRNITNAYPNSNKRHTGKGACSRHGPIYWQHGGELFASESISGLRSTAPDSHHRRTCVECSGKSIDSVERGNCCSHRWHLESR